MNLLVSTIVGKLIVLSPQKKIDLRVGSRFPEWGPAFVRSGGGFVKWNGKQIALEMPITVLEFLQQQGYNAQRVAVERNGEIVRRADFEKELLRDEDTVEVVTFVGGG